MGIPKGAPARFITIMVTPEQEASIITAATMHRDSDGTPRALTTEEYLLGLHRAAQERLWRTDEPPTDGTVIEAVFANDTPEGGATQNLIWHAHFWNGRWYDLNGNHFHSAPTQWRAQEKAT